MNDLFDVLNESEKENTAPLADRMRPVTLKEFLGQSHIAEEGSLLRRAISTDRLGSCIFRVRKNYACKHNSKLYGSEFC